MASPAATVVGVLATAHGQRPTEQTIAGMRDQRARHGAVKRDDDDDEQAEGADWRPANWVRFRCASPSCSRRRRWKSLRFDEENRDCPRCGRLMREVLPTPPGPPPAKRFAAARYAEGWSKRRIIKRAVRRFKLSVRVVDAYVREVIEEQAEQWQETRRQPMPRGWFRCRVCHGIHRRRGKVEDQCPGPGR